MVVVCRVNHGLVVRADAGHAAHHVVRDVAADAALDVRLQPDRKFNRVECSRLTCLVDSFVQVTKSGHRQQPLGYIVLNPRRGAQRVAGVVLQVALLDSL